MRKLLLFAFFLIGIGNVCFAVSRVSVMSLGTIPYSAKIMIMYRGDESLDSWTVRNAKTYLARSLESCGYTLTKDIKSATHVMWLSYGASEPFEVTETKQRLTDAASATGTNAQASAVSYEYYDETSEKKVFWVKLLTYGVQNGALNENTDFEIEMAQAFTSGQTVETAFPYLFAAAIDQGLFCKPSGGRFRWYPETGLFGTYDKRIVKNVRKFLENPY